MDTLFAHMNMQWYLSMNESQDRLIADLLAWADKCGNWRFRESLETYYELLKQREDKPQQVSALEANLRKDWGCEQT